MSTTPRRSKVEPVAPAPPRLRHPLRRPFAGLAISFLSGQLAGLFFPLPASALLMLCWALLAGAILLRRTLAGLFPLHALIVASAWTLASNAVHPASPRHLDAWMERPREYVQLRGVIADDPILEPAATTTEWTRTLTAQVLALNRAGGWEEAEGRVAVRWRASLDRPPPHYGEIWEWSGILRKQPDRGPSWRHLPSYRLTVDDRASSQTVIAGGNWVKQVSYRGRHHAHRLLGAGLENFPDQTGIMRALLLGYRQELPEHLQKLFALTGTLHIFAISGVHVGVFAGLMIAVIRLFGVPSSRWALYLAPMLILYTIGTGMRPSAVRACVMALVFVSAYLFQRRPDPPTALALAACLITAFDPPQLLAPGFIFSFVIVAGLMRLYPVLSHQAAPLLAGELYVPESQGRQKIVLRYVVGLAVASIAAWIASAPLTAYYFNLFSPVALIGNLFVIPAAFLAVLTGCLTLVTGALSPTLAEVFNFANVVILSGLIWIIEGLARLPGAYFHVRSPSLPWMLFYYAVLFGGLVITGRVWRRVAVLIAAGIAVSGLIFWAHDRSLVVTVLDAGDGHAALIQQRGGPSILYDAGPRYRSAHTVRAIRQAGAQRLDVVIISHPRAGHFGGLPDVLREMEVGEIWAVDHPTRSAVWAEALALATQKNIPVRIRAAGEAGVWPGGLSWEILHPPRRSVYRRAGDASLVLRVANGATSFLFTGGAGGRVEQTVLQGPVSPRADVWVIGNQGTDEAASEAWLQEVLPREVVLAVGPVNRRGWPEREVLARLGNGPWRLWRTDEWGAVTIRAHSAIRFGRRVDHLHVTPAYTPDQQD